MIIPVRCFTCGKVLANKWNAYQEKVKELESTSEQPEENIHALFESKLKGKILHELGITKMCCKRHMLTHIDIIDYL